MAAYARTIDEARGLIRASLEAVRRGELPIDFSIADDVWEILEASGELDAWEIEERAIRAAAGERDEAEDEDDVIARWYAYGRDPYYLGMGANDQAEFLLGVPEPSWAWNSSLASQRMSLWVSAFLKTLTRSCPSRCSTTCRS